METIKFEDLGLIEPILKAINEQDYDRPTDIQAKTIPLIVSNKDVIGGSKTGSGKTLAFSCGIIQKSRQGEGIQALVLVPTRELAQQVAKFFRMFSKYKKLNITTIYGGVAINPQMRSLQQAEVVIGTPGRILDHIGRNTINLRKVNTLVLDEADMMLDMGFLPDVERIIREIPKKRQTLIFSATIFSEINDLTRKHMYNPIRISTEEYVDSSKLTQEYFNVPNNQKFSLLVQMLKQERKGLVMVFCNTRLNSDFVGKNLKYNGINSTVIHGGLRQHSRNTILQKFHEGKVHVLVCTDVAARGLDIKGVSHIYNYDTCKEPKQYIHRIGRTARAGKNGKAITLLSERDHENFTRVLANNDVNIQKKETPHIERARIVFKTPPRRRTSFGSYERSGSRFGRPSHGRPGSGDGRPSSGYGRSNSRFGRSGPRSERPNPHGPRTNRSWNRPHGRR